MKSLRLITPLVLAVTALPLILTGCNRSADTGTTTDMSTNAPAAADTNTTTTATSPTMDTNATPAKADTNGTPPAADTNLAPSTNTTPSGM
jgi:uncharacterized lipoprotein NlpE involved in copper resistance